MIQCPKCGTPMQLKDGIDVVCDELECSCGFELKTQQLKLPLKEKEKKS